jgi:hypothetical protein
MNRVQIPRLKHGPSGRLLDGTSEWRGPTAGVIIFPDSSRSRKRSSGLKSKHRRGCRSVAAHPKHSVVLRPHNRSPTDIDAAHVRLVQSTAYHSSSMPQAADAAHVFGRSSGVVQLTQAEDVSDDIFSLRGRKHEHWHPRVRRC